MTDWNRTFIDTPDPIPVFGPEEIDPESGLPWRPAPGRVEGCHLNVARSILTPAMAAHEVAPDPATPSRTFAGDARGPDGRFALTAFLRFEDEDEAMAIMGEWAV